jgi:chromosome segregation ATPase
MSSTLFVVDREVVQDSFRQWQTEQSLLDAQLAESVSALDAYQSHLDAWQQELAREREELRQLRAALERDCAATGIHDDQWEQCNQELNDTRQKVASLTTALLARTEELRELDRQRGDTQTELALVRARERELTAAITAQQQSSEAQRRQWESELAQLRLELGRAVEHSATGVEAYHGEPSKNGHSKPEPRATASPVLGSVMEQFGKLRQQRSMNRPNQPKPR